jgi:hypothetical protein
MQRFIKLFIAPALVALALAGCNTDRSGRSAGLTLQGVEPLAGGYHYENWVVVAGRAFPAGKFNVTQQGQIVDLQGQPIDQNRFMAAIAVRNAESWVITIEPPGDVDGIPSNVKFLAGNFVNGSATLTSAHPAVFGNDFSGAAGSFLFATPTAADPMANPLSGVWFLMPGAGGMEPSLQLPALPEGWIYEGWAVIDGVPLTTGKFSSVSGADMAAPFSGPNPGPPFPGEDFLMNAPAGVTLPTDLSGLPIVITIEPVPDDSPAPFAFRPLRGMSPDPAAPMTSYSLTNTRNTFPTGNVQLD